MARTELSTVEMLRRLVAFDTTSRGSNLALIDFARNYLRDWGIESELVFDPGGEKANLYATLGPDDVPGICLSGHTDVVPVDGQAWRSDPFALTEREGTVVGRGASDMKGFIAAALAMVPEFLRRGPQTPIHFALSYDEEVGCMGVRGLIAKLEARAVKPRLCIIGEPTSMQPVTGHKGKRSLRCRVQGQEAHSALTHLGVNAVEVAAEVVAKLRQMARRRRDEGPFDPTYTPPYTTVHTGTIAGGTALNIVPRECRFDFEIRHLPTDDPEPLLEELRRFARSLEPEMKRIGAETGIVLDEINAIPALSIAADHEVVELAQSLSGANGTGKVSFGTEGGLFQEAGIPTVVCGPGSIEQAHKPDEFIALDQLRLCEGFLHRLADRVSRH